MWWHFNNINEFNLYFLCDRYYYYFLTKKLKIKCSVSNPLDE